MKDNFSVGDTVKVYEKITEGDKTRLFAFEGIIISSKGSQENKSITVRKIGALGIGVERIWFLSSPLISKITIKKKGKVKRAKLLFLRKRLGKKALAVKRDEETPDENSQIAPQKSPVSTGKPEESKDNDQSKSQ